MSNSEPVNVKQSGSVVNKPAFEDEAGLFDILAFFMQYRWLMLGIVFCVTLATILIVFVLPKVYRAEVIINPPLIKDVEQLNIFDTGTMSQQSSGTYFFKITDVEVYDKFIRFLNSKQLQLNFFKTNNLFDYLKDEKGEDNDEFTVFQKKFTDKIKLDDLRYRNKNELETIFISLEGRDEKLIVEWLNKYVVYVDEYTIKSIVEGINKKAQLQVEGVGKQIESLRDVEKSRRLDLIEQYQEAVAVAETIGLTDQVSISLAPNDKLIEKMGFSINPGDVPLYLRGSKALRAELKILQQRKKDDPFIPDLRDLQHRMSFFENLNVTTDSIHAANVDQFAYVSNKAVKPKRMLLVVVGVFFGCLVAVFTALIKNLHLRQMLESGIMAAPKK